MSTKRTASGSIALGEQRHLVCCSVCGKSADRSSKKHSLAQERHLYLPCGWDQVSGIYRLHNRDQNRKQLQKFDNNSFLRERKKYEMQLSHVVTVAETWVTLDLQDKWGSRILSDGLVGKWEENYSKKKLRFIYLWTPSSHSICEKLFSSDEMQCLLTLRLYFCFFGSTSVNLLQLQQPLQEDQRDTGQGLHPSSSDGHLVSWSTEQHSSTPLLQGHFGAPLHIHTEMPPCPSHESLGQPSTLPRIVFWRCR